MELDSENCPVFGTQMQLPCFLKSVVTAWQLFRSSESLLLQQLMTQSLLSLCALNVTASADFCLAV